MFKGGHFEDQSGFKIMQLFPTPLQLSMKFILRINIIMHFDINWQDEWNWQTLYICHLDKFHAYMSGAWKKLTLGPVMGPWDLANITVWNKHMINITASFSMDSKRNYMEVVENRQNMIFITFTKMNTKCLEVCAKMQTSHNINGYWRALMWCLVIRHISNEALSHLWTIFSVNMRGHLVPFS